jgi:hypothetical protein
MEQVRIAGFAVAVSAIAIAVLDSAGITSKPDVLPVFLSHVAAAIACTWYAKRRKAR